MTDSRDPPVDLRFIADDWSTMNWPPCLRPFRFTHRFEVIQETSVEGAVGMHIDRPLWTRLAEYLALEGKHHRVVVLPSHARAGFGQRGLAVSILTRLPGAAAAATKRIEAHGVPLADFLAADGPDEGGDWDPPDAVFVLDDRGVRLALTAERYYLAGGPDIHHDSATYAFHARRDLSGAVIAFLQLAPVASRWTFDILVSLADHR